MYTCIGNSNAQDATILKVQYQVIGSKAEIKYRGVYIDKDLKYQKQIKTLLSKIVHGYMHICTQEHNSHFIEKIVLNSFAVSHIQFSSVLLANINQNLIKTLEKQLNWAIKICFRRQKFDSSSDIKISLGILLISLLFDCRAATYCHSIMKTKEACLLKFSFYQQQG